MSRIIVLDTETTGLEPTRGHRIIEIGCVELVNRRLTGSHFHVYINPERDIEASAMEVHGITNEFLANKPVFFQIADQLLDYIKGAELVIHNAPFDVGFLNHEMGLLANPPGNIQQYCTITDSLALARKKHPGQRNSLDALCKRYGVDNSNRTLHGALLDAEILADVYLIMTGGQTSLSLGSQDGTSPGGSDNGTVQLLTEDRPALKVVRATDQELAAHRVRLDLLQGAAGRCLWRNIWPD